MTDLNTSAAHRTETDGLPECEAVTEPWRPYVHEAILTPQMALGPEDTDPADLKRLKRYFAALVAARRAPVHINVAFNAVYFGYDVTTRSYVGGPLDLFAFPVVNVVDTTEALPVGAMINIAAGADPLFGEIVYKEGAHPELHADGSLPTWLSGAPAGAGERGQADDLEQPVLWERLVVDFDAFGADLSRTRAQLERMRRQRRTLRAEGHLLLDARYDSRDDADLYEDAFYVRYLLTRGRDQLLSAASPMPLRNLLSEDAGDIEVEAALFGILRTIRWALTDLCDPVGDAVLHMWGDYAFTRASLRDRLIDTGPLGGKDMEALAAQLRSSAIPSRPSRWGRGPTTTYTAVGPQLCDIRDAGDRLTGLGYPVAVCHLNTIISQYISRDVDEDTGLLSGDIHLRLDDRWQGGGVWRAEHPGSSYAHVEFAEALGLGWQESLPSPLRDGRSDEPAAITFDSGIPADPSPAGGLAADDIPEDILLGDPRSADGENLAEPTPPQGLPTQNGSGRQAPEDMFSVEDAREDVPESDVVPQIPVDTDEDLDDVDVTDSQISWTQSLRLKHQLERYLPIPERVVGRMRSSGLNTGVRMRLYLAHDGYDLDPRERVHPVTAELLSSPRLTDVDWPAEFFSGITLSCTWAHGASVIHAESTLLDAPVVIDGDWDIEHHYDPRIVTRDTAPGEPRPPRAGRRSRSGSETSVPPILHMLQPTATTLSLADQVLRQIRRLGLLSTDGSAVLGYHNLSLAVYGGVTHHESVVTELERVVGDLIDAGKLRADAGSVDHAGLLRFPARAGQPIVPVIVYEPVVVTGSPGPPRRNGRRKLDARWVRSEPISRHLRDMTASGRHASEDAREAWRHDRERLGLAWPAELPEHWTYVQPKGYHSPE